MTGLYFRFHGWRGFSLANDQGDFFHYVWRLGFVTIYVCRICVLDAYRNMKVAARDALALLNRDGESR